MYSIARGLNVHSRVASQLQTDRTAAREGALGEHAPELRQQRRERQVGRRRQPSWPERLAQLVTAGHSIAIDDEIREQHAALPAGQLPFDPPAGHSGGETPAELDPRRLVLRLRIGHRSKLSPKPTSETPTRTRPMPAKEATMAYVISCDCGYISRGETEDELVEEANRHIEEVHPDMAGKVSRDDLLAMAEEV
jgi:predicted small metal-binding protein